MIYAFGGRNFFSFRDDFVVDFRVSEKTSERGVFIRDGQNALANRVMGVFGANASGKTHLLKALGFLRWFILHSASQQEPEEKLPAVQFRFSSRTSAATVLWVEFSLSNTFYRYEVEFDPDRVLRESLRKRIDRLNNVFDRTWDGAKNRYRLRAQHELTGIDPALGQRRNASLISTAHLVDHEGSRNLYSYFGSFYGNLGHHGRTGIHDPDPWNIISTGEFFHREPELLDWVNARLSRFDLGLDAIRIAEGVFIREDGKEERKPLPVGVHRFGDLKDELSLFEESRGTQALFVLLRHILPVLRSGGVAFIDEFELGLHSHMIPRLLDLFYGAKHNPRHAQLIFSTQADYVIQRLEKCQMLFVEKDEHGVSDVYQLSDIKGVRVDENHYAKYHAGAYGGIPKI